MIELVRDLFFKTSLNLDVEYNQAVKKSKAMKKLWDYTISPLRDFDDFAECYNLWKTSLDATKCRNQQRSADSIKITGE